jgi:hypothetical protein
LSRLSGQRGRRLPSPFETIGQISLDPVVNFRPLPGRPAKPMKIKVQAVADFADENAQKFPRTFMHRSNEVIRALE